jgi:deoxycytidylate deaminase
MVHQNLVEEAINQANRANDFVRKYRHGAVIFNKRGTVLSKGFNCKRNIPALRKYGYNPEYSLHSEANAILKADREDLVGSSILVVRTGATKLCLSKPCEFCMNMIHEAGIKNVYYSDTDGTIKEMSL